ncbi:DDE-type integrase/transposase/recombinase [Stappia stellulata]|uniref:DDE-type integrase/transposase/recombinase n=1 Tax=Stappia stellulata TaxID=71235 RepID=UPI001CD3E8F7|nr:DDE-type integrase/transposase/recombinase [Stappia stellulata]MCA1242972.1 DDE-type integrase/transposase/recombinase [Stappia stellulata]
MKEWFTAREAAELDLPGLPETESGILRAAERESWHEHPFLSRTRKGQRGGGREYHFRLFPTEAQLEFTRRALSVRREVTRDANGNTKLTFSGTEAARVNRDARLAIVQAFESFSAGLTLGLSSRLQIFADRYNTRSIEVEDWIRDTVPHLSKRSLQRWRSAKRAGKADALAVDRSTARKGKGVLDTANGGAVRAFILALVAHQPHLSADHIRTLCRDEFGETLQVERQGRMASVETPPVRTFQHFLKRLRETEKVALTKLSNPDKYRSTMAPAGIGALRHIREPNALWQIDASPVDALCTDGRHAIYACIDIATRRTLFYVSKTPRASAVAMLLRRAILAWGVPDTIKTDNGSDFVANDTKRLFAALDIEMDVSDAYSPQQKGHVERVIKTFQHDCATLLPGFVGHNVADRKAIEDRKSFADRLGADTADLFDVSMTGLELQRFADAWTETRYNHRPHSALKGKTPAQAAMASDAEIRTVEARALDILLMPVAGKDGLRTVTKQGIRIDHFQYVINAALPGTQVFVRMDPNDAGRVIAFDAGDGTFIDEAICPELAGIHPSTVLAAKREAQSETLDAATREAKRHIREITKGRPLIERVLDVAARDVPNVVSLPRRESEHTTADIRNALDAVAEPATPQKSTREAKAMAELRSDLTAPVSERAKVTPIRSQETPQLRFKRALDLEARLEAGEELETTEAMWLGGYQAGPEYRALALMSEDFGG